MAGKKKTAVKKTVDEAQLHAAEFLEAVKQMANDHKINPDQLFAAMESALVSAYKKHCAGSNKCSVRVSIDRENGTMAVYVSKKVVSEVVDPESEVSLEEARSVNARYELGDLMEQSIALNKFIRIAAQSARNVVTQEIRKADSDRTYTAMSEKENEILTAMVVRQEGEDVYVELGNAEGLLVAAEQMPGEELKPNDRIKVYVLEVRKGGKGAQILVSRTHSGLVKRLFENEVPELQDGTVQIKAIARDPGSCTKMAVFTTDKYIDPLGACIGPHGMRIENVISELKFEKIEVIQWSGNVEEFIGNALSPARVSSVTLDKASKKSDRSHVVL